MLVFLAAHRVDSFIGRTFFVPIARLWNRVTGRSTHSLARIADVIFVLVGLGAGATTSISFMRVVLPAGAGLLFALWWRLTIPMWERTFDRAEKDGTLSIHGPSLRSVAYSRMGFFIFGVGILVLLLLEIAGGVLDLNVLSLTGYGFAGAAVQYFCTISIHRTRPKGRIKARVKAALAAMKPPPIAVPIPT